MRLRLATPVALAIVFVSALTAGEAGAQPAVPPAGRAPQSCFRTADVYSWNAPDRRTVYLKVNLHDYYALKLLGDCGDIDFDQSIGLESRGSDWICSGLDVTVIAHTPIGRQRCMATGLHRLSPAEVAAIPPKQRP